MLKLSGYDLKAEHELLAESARRLGMQYYILDTEGRSSIKGVSGTFNINIYWSAVNHKEIETNVRAVFAAPFSYGLQAVSRAGLSKEQPDFNRAFNVQLLTESIKPDAVFNSRVKLHLMETFNMGVKVKIDDEGVSYIAPGSVKDARQLDLIIKHAAQAALLLKT
jgi:hypothetical protein